MLATTAEMTRLDKIANAMSEEFGKPPEEFAQEAEAFLAVLDYYLLPEFDLLFWIREKKPGKEWTLREWRARCSEIDDLRGKLGLGPPHQIGGEDGHSLCPRCHSSILNRCGAAFFCAACGSAVQLQ